MMAPTKHELKASEAISRYAVIGNPIAHSLSPLIHQRFAQLTGQAMTYNACLSPKDGFKQTIATLKHSGVCGCNVTVPFKQEAAKLADTHSAEVNLAQAANTLVFQENGHIAAHNTDGIGLVRDITIHAQTPLKAQTILLLGAGGAAASCLGALIQQNPARIIITNRTEERAKALVLRHQALAKQFNTQLDSLSFNQLSALSYQLKIDVVINATSSSLQQQSLPLPPAASLLQPTALAYDMMYGSAVQGFFQWASLNRKNARLRDGLGILVEQAAQAFFIWRGILPPVEPVLKELRQVKER